MSEQFFEEYKKLLAAADNDRLFRQFAPKHIKDLYALISEPSLIRLFEITDREKWVIEQFWGEGKKFNAIAEELGLSSQRVHQIYSKAFTKIKIGIANAINECKRLEKLESENEGLKNEYDKLKSIIEKYKREDDPADYQSKVRKLRFGELGSVSVRLYKCLSSSNILTIDDLLQRDAEYVFKIEGFGRKTFHDLHYVLDQYGIKLDRSTGRWKFSNQVKPIF